MAVDGSGGDTGSASKVDEVVVSMDDQQRANCWIQGEGRRGRGGRGRGGGGRGAGGTRMLRVGAAAAEFGVGGLSAQGEGHGSRAEPGADAEPHPREVFARQLQHPEWLTDVPHDLQHSW